MLSLELIIFLTGLVIGSFLNVVIYRLPKNLGIVWGRSICPKCKEKIKWFDNVPLISFIVLEGRCRFCRKRISLIYPAVESITGFLFILVSLPYLNDLGGLSYSSSLIWFLNLVFVSGLIAVFFIDLEHKIILDKIVIPLIVVFTPLLIFADYSHFFTNLLPSAIISFLFLLLIFLVTHGKGMGFGDVKLAFLLGLFLGFPKIISAFYIAFLTGAFFGIILILGKKAKLKQKIAFGPFLAFGGVASLLWGEKILSLVQKLFF